ncbi:MAG TPA: polysaccharide deacetylase family protein [Bacteroidales bacterium]|nr:polysaccharide deacetylase family protein [Bacteroidales bacterium]
MNYITKIVRYPKVYKNGIYRIKTSSLQLYLTFDDGPTPVITEKVLALLDKYNAKSSFFCIGENAEKFPEIIEKIKQNGHSLGNHSYSHLKIFKVSCKNWFLDVLRKSPVSEAKFFRPPYGKILPCHYMLLKRKYKIVFWDVMTYDYREDLTTDEIDKIILKYVRNGSLIVFHDTLKATPRMLPALENCLKHYSDLGYEFCRL